MNRSYHRSQARSGIGWIFLLLVFIAAIGVVGWKAFSQEAPLIRFSEAVKGIGKQTVIEFTVEDKEYSLKDVSVDIQQGNRNFSVPLVSEIHNTSSPPWWKAASKAERM